MSVVRRGKVWYVKFKFKGEPFFYSTKQTNRRTAQQIEAKHRLDLATGAVGIHERVKVPTLEAFAPDFMKAIETQCAEKPRTVEFYRSRMKTLCGSDLGKKQLDRIDEAAIEKYRQTRSVTTSRRKKALTPASVNRELATLRRALRLAHEWKLISRVPRVKLLRGEKCREFVLPHSMEAAYFAALPSPLCDIAVILLETGLRLGEALSLDWRQVRLEPANGARFGYVTVSAGKAKSGKSRNVPLSQRAVDVLRQHGPAESGLVFHRPDGKPLEKSLLGQQQKRVRDLLNLPADFVLHSLRHTFGTRLGEASADAFTIMRLMGHSNVTVSQRYVHPSPEAVELAYERLTALNMHKGGAKSGTAIEGQLGAVQ